MIRSILASSLLLLFAPFVSGQPMEFATISQKDLQAAMAAGSVAILDANGTRYYRIGRIPGAIDFAAHQNEIGRFLPSDRTRLIVVYCANEKCPHYLLAARAVAALGYTNVKHFAPGIAGWRSSGAPIETETKMAAPAPVGGGPSANFAQRHVASFKDSDCGHVFCRRSETARSKGGVEEANGRGSIGFPCQLQHAKGHGAEIQKPASLAAGAATLVLQTVANRDHTGARGQVGFMIVELRDLRAVDFRRRPAGLAAQQALHGPGQT